MRVLWHDLRYAFRFLLKRPGFAAVAVIPLAIGIGANTAFFSVFNGVLLKTLPYREPDRLYVLSETSPQFQTMSISYLNFQAWQAQSRSFTGMALFRSNGFNLTGTGDPERVSGCMVSGNFFEVLGISARRGRWFLREEDRRGATPVMLVSEELWKRRFGGAPDLVGRALTLDGKSRVVAGIVPAGFRFYGKYDVYVPLGQWDSMLIEDRQYHPGLYGVARLRDGVTLTRARAELDGIALRLARQYPKEDATHGIGITPLKDDIVGDVRGPLWVLLGAVAFVLLIACANVANLLLARATSREREIAVRTAMGASRGRLLRQLLTESTVLALAGGLLGLGLAAWGTDLALAALPDGVPRVAEIGMDGRVLGFTLGASLLTGILFGLAPAWQHAHSRLHETLKEGGRALIGGRRGVRNALVVGEIALAVVLLAGAGLALRSMAHLLGVDPGFQPRGVLTMHIAASPLRVGTPEAARTYLRQMVDRIEQIPGVEAASISTDVPLTGEDMEFPFWVQGRPRPATQGEANWALMYQVSPGYLKVMRIPLLRGRFFTQADNEHSPPVAVIDELLAASLFPHEDPIGKSLVFGLDATDKPARIVGIVGHVAHWGLDSDAQSKVRFQAYQPVLQFSDQFVPLVARSTTYLVRTSGSAAAVASAVKREAIGADRDQPVYDVRSMEQVVSASLARRRFIMVMLAAFALLALLLAAVGIYAVISYTVGQRTREIGIRVALGARQDTVLRLILGQGMTLVLAGIGLGLAAALVLTRLMRSLLFQVSATDPLTLAAVAVLLCGVAALASYLPARRAARIDPTVALRYE